MRDGRDARLEGLYRGSAALLVCGGPSLAVHDLSRLRDRRLLTMAVNNAATLIRPQLWACVDPPHRFAETIWRDPTILKFVPLAHFDQPFRSYEPRSSSSATPRRVCELPAVFAYRRNAHFRPDRFLHEDSFNWGQRSSTRDAAGRGGGRSVLLVALRLLFHLGVRRVYLLGCDFSMRPECPYAYPQACDHRHAQWNNDTYPLLNARLAELRPYFDRAGFYVVNCTPESRLTAFRTMSYDDALSEAELTEAAVEQHPFQPPSRASLDDAPMSAVAAACVSAIPPVPQSRPEAPRSRLRLEIVSHCWRYSRLLTYQLSSLVRHPPRELSVTMTVFFARSDAATCRVLDFFAARAVQGVAWNWRELDEARLLRRAVGRNLAALESRADWVWLCDCDQVFHAGCLDGLAQQLAACRDELAFPAVVHLSRLEPPAGKLLRQAAEPSVLDIDVRQFAPLRFHRAVGGLQIVRGDVARRIGYCKDMPQYLEPAVRWMRTREDVAFRATIAGRAAPLDVPGLYRIEHSVKGRHVIQPAL